jgi:hypothetical protein
MFYMGLVRICPPGGNSRAAISASTVFAANLALGLLAGLTPAFGDQRSSRTDGETAGRFAQRAEPRISLPAAIVAQPASQVVFAIDVVPRESLPITGFIRLRGLPQFVSINDSHAIGPGAWAVPLYALPVLRMNIPVAISGRSEVEIALMSVDGRVIAEARTSLIIAAPTGLETTKREAPAPSTPAAPIPTLGKSTPEPTPAEPALEKKGAQELLALGERYLAQGKVGGARLFFRQAADAGDARAAMRLAATYDPAELSILKVQGIAPDALEARKWYERARELGATEAEELLARLGDK